MLSRKIAIACLLPLAVMLASATGCQTDITGDDQYYACAPASVGAADERCRDGFVCRNVEGNAGCVPEDEKDRFDPIDGSDLDGGRSDADDVSEDADDSDATDTSDDADASATDTSETASEDASDGGGDVNCPEIPVTLRVLAPDGGSLEQEARAGRSVQIVTDTAPAWVEQGNATDIQLDVDFDPTLEYPSWVDSPDAPVFDYELDSQRYEANFVLSRLGEFTFTVEATGPDNCVSSGTVQITTVAYATGTTAERCAYIEYFWNDDSESSLTFDSVWGLDDQFEVVSTHLSRPRYHLYEINGDDSVTGSSSAELHLNNRALPKDTEVFVRAYLKGWDGPITAEGKTEEDAPMSIGSISHNPEADACGRLELEMSIPQGN
jgi:hypothetical protein